MHLKKRAENIKNNPRTIEKTLTDILGIGSVPLGAITNHEKSIIHKENGNKTTYHKINFSTGAVAQFYITEPASDSHPSPQKYLLALPGCSGSPDKILGLTEPDYSNSFGLEAVKMGWTVIAPYILTHCNTIGHFDTLGAMSSGSLLYGYEIQKIQRIVDFVLNDNPSKNISVYGISLGAKLALFLSTLDPRYKNIILSGAISQDENYFWRQLLPAVNEYQRT